MEYKNPNLNSKHFTCPNCNIIAGQHVEHYKLIKFSTGETYYVYDSEDQIPNLHIVDTRVLSVSFCANCQEIALWINHKMVYPERISGPNAIEDMPNTVKEIYNEARAVFDKSPKAAAALLRLAIQVLCKELGYTEGTLDNAIKEMIKDGLDKKVEMALDSIRVIGNNAVHPGEINIDDNKEIVLKLFTLLNFIVKEMITRPKEIAEVFEFLPEGSRAAIGRRNQKINKK